MRLMGLAQYVIAEARSRAGLGLRELARLAGTSHATLRRYETGAVDPSVETMVRIVAACGYELRTQLVTPNRDADHLAETFLRLTPAERLESLRRWDRLRGAAHAR